MSANATRKQNIYQLKFIGTFKQRCCSYKVAAEQKARATYEWLINLAVDDPDVVDPLRFLREREVVHFQRFGEALEIVQDYLASKKFY